MTWQHRGGFAARLRFAAAFGTICSEGTHGACEDKTFSGDAETEVKKCFNDSDDER